MKNYGYVMDTFVCPEINLKNNRNFGSIFGFRVNPPFEWADLVVTNFKFGDCVNKIDDFFTYK